MNRRPRGFAGGHSKSSRIRKPDQHAATDELLSLMGDVLDALEDAGHPEFSAAKKDPALKDSATNSSRKAWLAIYGPHTDVL